MKVEDLLRVLKSYGSQSIELVFYSEYGVELSSVSYEESYCIKNYLLRQEVLYLYINIFEVKDVTLIKIWIKNINE